jgi:hypothetical protein
MRQMRPARRAPTPATPMRHARPPLAWAPASTAVATQALQATASTAALLSLGMVGFGPSISNKMAGVLHSFKQLTPLPLATNSYHPACAGTCGPRSYGRVCICAARRGQCHGGPLPSHERHGGWGSCPECHLHCTTGCWRVKRDRSGGRRWHGLPSRNHACRLHRAYHVQGHQPCCHF